MKKNLPLLLALSLIFGITGMTSHAQAGLRQPVDSLNDLPFNWSGVAGDLITKVPATLTLKRITSVERIPSEFYRLEASYSVEGELTFGSRVVPLKTIVIRAAKGDGNRLELTFFFDDDLALSLSTAVTYDEASDEFVMKEYADRGVRHLVLRAKARRE